MLKRRNLADFHKIRFPLCTLILHIVILASGLFYLPTLHADETLIGPGEFIAWPKSDAVNISLVKGENAKVIIEWKYKANNSGSETIKKQQAVIKASQPQSFMAPKDANAARFSVEGYGPGVVRVTW